MNQHDFGQLVSGRRTGFKASVLRFFLRVISQVYKAAAVLHSFLYSSGCLKTHHSDSVVISIGNITTGGTGKTPLVIWLCKFLQQKQISCAVLTRGYKGGETKIDEPAIIAENCPQAKVIVNPNRIEGAAEAVNNFGAKALVMDDGFQHRGLHRDIDIVTIDATCPFGYGKLLPAGLLREPISSLERTDAVVLTRCDQVSEPELSRTEKELRLVNPNMVITRSIHYPIFAKSLTGEKITIEQLRNKKVFAFCGIGNPDAFLSTIKNIGVNLAGSKIYNDHYHYTISDVNDIHNHANRLKADLILTTQKDWKTILLTSVKKDIPFAYLEIEIKFTIGEDKLKQLIEDALAGKILRNKK